MAHNLNYNKESGQYSMVTKHEVAWHGLGQVIDHALTTTEAIEQSHLNYPVEAGQAYVMYNNPIMRTINDIEKPVKGIHVLNTRFTYRADNGDVLIANGRALTNAYTVIQNVDAFDFFDSMIGEGQAQIETAGALGKGETIFISAKLPEKLLIHKDEIDTYLLLTNTHDGSGSITVLFTNIRVVCNNTLNFALSTARNKYRIKHTANAERKLKDLAIMLSEQHLYNRETQEILTMLASKQVESTLVKPYVYNLFMTPEELAISKSKDYKLRDVVSTRKENTIKHVLTAIDDAPGQELHRGSYFWMYNGVTSFMNNVDTYKTDESKFNKLILDSGTNSLSQRAFDTCLELALNN